MSKQFVLIILDGAGDVNRVLNRTPLALAQTSSMDFLAREGCTGLMQTLYPELPRDSLVAQLGIFGWSPQIYYPNGRASAELLALHQVELGDQDLVFRANVVRMDRNVLASYNADYITSDKASQLIDRINNKLHTTFPEIELYHNSDFRNTLVVRSADVEAKDILCHEPHECHGYEFNIRELLKARSSHAKPLIDKINCYLAHVGELLAVDTDFVIFPWGVSNKFCLPSFHHQNNFNGRAVVIGSMDFLHGMAKAGCIDFCKVGNGRPDTDYYAKGQAVLSCLEQGYDFVACHINGADEASHMYDVSLKLDCIEQIDDKIVSPLIDYFLDNKDRIGGVMILPDHYTNTLKVDSNSKRIDSHSLHPVPFIIWNGRNKDATRHFSEDGVSNGYYSYPPISHLQALSILGVSQQDVRVYAEKKYSRII